MGMPQAYVAKLAKKHNISMESAESKWDKAKQIAEKSGKGENFAYVTSIFKNMMNENVFSGGFKDYLRLTEMDSDESYDRAPRGNRFEFDDSEEFGDSQDYPFDDELSDDELSDDELSDDELSDDELSDDELSDDELSDDELSDDELSDDELSDDELSDDELEFDDGNEHKLADIVSPDELSDDELSDDNNLEFNFGESDDQYVSLKSSLLNELMLVEQKKKKKGIKKLAKAVYHRDYVKTKNRPYRKYHPENDE